MLRVVKFIFLATQIFILNDGFRTRGALVHGLSSVIVLVSLSVILLTVTLMLSQCHQQRFSVRTSTNSSRTIVTETFH